MSDKIASQIEDESDRKLTNRQREFAKFFVDGIYSNAECARKAGYSNATAHVYASKLLAGRDHPQVLEYIKELRHPHWTNAATTSIIRRGRGCGAIFSGY